MFFFLLSRVHQFANDDEFIPALPAPLQLAVRCSTNVLLLLLLLMRLLLVFSTWLCHVQQSLWVIACSKCVFSCPCLSCKFSIHLFGCHDI